MHWSGIEVEGSPSVGSKTARTIAIEQAGGESADRFEETLA